MSLLHACTNSKSISQTGQVQVEGAPVKVQLLDTAGQVNLCRKSVNVC